ncbi:MAG: NADP-dependent isocitrate dehydrogenase [Myxococcota bacterium]
MSETRITVARGDGIGPEVMDATLRVLEAAKAPLEYDFVEIGERMYREGHSSGIPPEAWRTIRRSPAFLKAPITTPLGGGYKSLNVTIRKTLNLFANVRPTKAYTPFVASAHPGMNIVVVRENEEDLYAGIEHQQTPEVTQVLKLITRPGTERIVRYAFDYARAYGRKKVTCMTKDNIMKHTDGLFHRVFDEIATEYPDIESDHHIIDIGAARVATQPERFDVIVTLNLYGDILSDIASQVAGSIGLAGSANIGPRVSMFEAVHGSAPDIAGKGVANPSGLLLGATQMLVHLGYAGVAETIKNAWLATLESGIHPSDIYRPGVSTRHVGTDDFTHAVIERLGETPRQLAPVHYHQANRIAVDPRPTPEVKKVLEGIDVFLDWSAFDRSPNILGKTLEGACPDDWRLKMITNRGVKVYPDGVPETFCTDHWRCRFLPAGDATSFDRVLALLTEIHERGLDVIKTEHLYTFDGERGYSLGQGE